MDMERIIAAGLGTGAIIAILICIIILLGELAFVSELCVKQPSAPLGKRCLYCFGRNSCRFAQLRLIGWAAL